MNQTEINCEFQGATSRTLALDFKKKSYIGK